MKSRRSFRFSLRTILVFLTLSGLWLGVQGKWIKDRRTTLKEFTSRADRLEQIGGNTTSAPWSLLLWREQGISSFEISNEFSRHERARLQLLFPEARIRENVPIKGSGPGCRINYPRSP